MSNPSTHRRFSVDGLWRHVDRPSLAVDGLSLAVDELRGHANGLVSCVDGPQQRVHGHLGQVDKREGHVDGPVGRQKCTKLLFRGPNSLDNTFACWRNAERSLQRIQRNERNRRTRAEITCRYASSATPRSHASSCAFTSFRAAGSCRIFSMMYAISLFSGS